MTMYVRPFGQNYRGSPESLDVIIACDWLGSSSRDTYLFDHNTVIKFEYAPGTQNQHEQETYDRLASEQSQRWAAKTWGFRIYDDFTVLFQERLYPWNGDTENAEYLDAVAVLGRFGIHDLTVDQFGISPPGLLKCHDLGKKSRRL